MHAYEIANSSKVNVKTTLDIVSGMGTDRCLGYEFYGRVHQDGSVKVSSLENVRVF